MRCALTRRIRNQASSGVHGERSRIGATRDFEGPIHQKSVLKLGVRRELAGSYEAERFHGYKSSIAFRRLLGCNLDVADTRKYHGPINEVISDCATHSDDRQQGRRGGIISTTRREDPNFDRRINRSAEERKSDGHRQSRRGRAIRHQ